MPSELELGRVANNIQELLYGASDLSHDRCVKVLMARAKVRHRRRDKHTGPKTNKHARMCVHAQAHTLDQVFHLKGKGEKV